MAHSKLRNESNCLNCNARVFGPYCHFCGQPNTEPRETVLGLLVHFFNDITHFEGKFISSLRLLLFKPGRLTLEYIRGRRASYMNPVRMYIFTSAFFFLIFFLVFDDEQLVNVKKENKANSAELSATKTLLSKAKSADDTLFIKSMIGPVADSVIADVTAAKQDSTDDNELTKFKSIAAYDTAQAALPAAERDTWLERLVKRRSIKIGEQYNEDYERFFKEANLKFIHSFPKILFVSLPLFALLLTLLYARQQQWYYVDHLIFSVHIFVFAFLWILLSMAAQKAGDYIPFLNYAFLKALWVLYFFVYLYKAMRYLYAQRRAKTVVKFLLLLTGMFIVTMVVFVVFFSFTVFTI